MDIPLNFDRNCDKCPIRHRAVCATCDTQEMQRLEAMKYYQSYAAGQPILLGGDHMNFVASIVAGTATIERLMEDGRQQTMGLLLPSDFIGRPGREAALYDVTAVTDVTLCCFRRDTFEDLLSDTPHVAQRMLEMSLDELDAARDWMLLLRRKTAREKIAAFLVMILTRSHTAMEKDARITLPLSRAATANFIGLTLETVSRQFTSLRQEGLIVLDGRHDVTIPDPDALRALAGTSSPYAAVRAPKRLKI